MAAEGQPLLFYAGFLIIFLAGRKSYNPNPSSPEDDTASSILYSAGATG